MVVFKYCMVLKTVSGMMKIQAVNRAILAKYDANLNLVQEYTGDYEILCTK